MKPSPSDELNAAIRTLRRLALFLCPPAAVLAFPLAVLTLSGELAPVDHVVRLQAEASDALYGSAYTEVSAYYKLASVRRRAPRIIVLGSSRANGFRASFFDAPHEAYNASRGVLYLRHMRQFLARLDAGAQPRFVLLVLDQNMFNERWDDRADEGPEPAIWAPGGDNPLGTVQAAWLKVYRDFGDGKFALADLARPMRHVGLAARARRAGFRSDGSYRYPARLEDSSFESTLRLVEQGVDRMLPCERVHPDFLAETGALLDELERRNIAAAAVLPPYAAPVWKRLSSAPSHRYLRTLAADLRPIFDRRGVPLLDASDLASLGGGDDEAIDGTHVGEKASLRILLRLSELSPALRLRAEPARLRKLLAAAPRGYSVFSD